MNEQQRKMIYDAYYEPLKRLFKYHPNKDEILRHLESGDCTLEEVDNWFRDNEVYQFNALAKIRGHDNGDGTITFRIISHD